MKRIVAIDILRGFALLGILVMNIMSFAMPSTAYFNPAAFGGDDPLNQATYALVHIFTDQKFMALFSLLFGASIMLLVDSWRRKGQRVARFHYTRNGWLLLIGLLHGFLLWEGDVLVVYAICAFGLYFFRNVAPKRQFALGLAVFLLPAVSYVAADLIIDRLSADQAAPLQAYWQPSDEVIAAEIAHYRGDYWPQVIDRWNDEELDEAAVIYVYYAGLVFEFFVRAFGMMLIGMAAYTSGIVTAQRTDRFYKRMIVLGLLGIALAAAGVWWNSAAAWAAAQMMFLGRLPNLLATPLIAGGYIGIIMLWSRSTVWAGLQTRLAAVGRTALSNYIAHSVIGTFIFYGFGLGLFGALNRWQLLPIVVAIWAVQLWLSPLWLRYFRYGLLEWGWRSLSYWRVQPLFRDD